jgi:hypothetical protein
VLPGGLRECKLLNSSTRYGSAVSLTATIVTTKPPRVVTEKEINATLAKSTAGASAPAAAAGTPAPATPQMAPGPAQAAATSGAAPRKLPKTARPFLALTGFASILAALGLTIRRHRSTH